MNADLIRWVWRRAGACCEYCHLPSAFYPAPFQIDHVISRQPGGPAVLENLALARIHCNRFKGSNIVGLDAETGELGRLLHPRTGGWIEHFMWDGPDLKGRTQIGRVPITALFINDTEAITVRKALGEEHVFGG